MALVALVKMVAATGPGGPYQVGGNGLASIPAIYAANPRTDTLEFAAYEFPALDHFICWSGTTADRPSSGAGQPFPPPAIGTPFFDTTLGKTIFAFAPGKWIDETGSFV
jgi:hypothetical protein